MKFEFTVLGLKSLQRLEDLVAKRILEKLHKWQSTDNPLAFAKKIKGGASLFRFQVGDWRVIATRNPKRKTLEILTVGHRSSVYKVS